MKKLLVLLAMLTMISMMFAQKLLLHEGFEGTTFPPAGWMLGGGAYTGSNGITIPSEANAEGYNNWMRSDLTAHLIPGGGTAVAISPSWYTSTYPTGWATDNWLITSPITFDTGHAMMLDFLIGQNYPTPGESYQIFWTTETVTNGMTADVLGALNKVTLYEETFSGSTGVQDYYGSRSVSLVGKVPAGTGRLLFRSYAMDCERLRLDEIKVWQPIDYDLSLNSVTFPDLAVGKTQNFTFNVTNNGAKPYEGTGAQLRLWKHLEESSSPSLYGSTNSITVTIAPGATVPILVPAITTDAGYTRLHAELTWTPDIDTTNNNLEQFWVYVSPGLPDIPPASIGGSSTTTSANIPTNLYYRMSASLSRYLATELGSAAANSDITHVTFFYNGADVAGDVKKIRILMQNDTETGGFATATAASWVATNWTTVYDGTPDLSGSGNGRQIVFKLDTPFTYTGNSLLVMVQKKDGSYAGGSQNWQVASVTPTNRNLNGYSDTVYWGPDSAPTSAPTRTSTVPKAIFTFKNEMGAISMGGVVTDKVTNDPIPGAVVRVPNSPLTVISGDDGSFAFEYFNKLLGVNLLANAAGYLPADSTPLNFTEGSLTAGLSGSDKSYSYAFKLTDAEDLTVKGKVGYMAVGDVYTVLPDAVVTLTHPLGKAISDTTDALGEFAVEGLDVIIGLEYAITVRIPTHERYTDKVTVTGQEFDLITYGLTLPDIVLTELLAPPAGIKAVQHKDADGNVDYVDITWGAGGGATIEKTMTHMRSEHYDDFWWNVDGGLTAGYAHRYTQAMLVRDGVKDGMLKRVGFWAPEALIGNSPTIEIYHTDAPVEQSSAQYNPFVVPAPVYTQIVPIAAIPAAGASSRWCYVDLDNPVSINKAGELWIAIKITQATVAYVVPQDSGPMGEYEVNNAYNPTYLNGSAFGGEVGWLTGATVSMTDENYMLVGVVDAPAKGRIILGNPNATAKTTVENTTVARNIDPKLLPIKSGIAFEGPSMPALYTGGAKNTRALINYNVYVTSDLGAINLTDIDSQHLERLTEPALGPGITTRQHIIDPENDITARSYKYAVEAIYQNATGDSLSAVGFSAALLLDVPPVQIDVKVTNASDAPIQGASVMLTHKVTNTYTYSLTTGANGIATIPNAYPGTYDIVVSHNDYMTKHATINATSTSAINTVTVKLQVGTNLLFESFEAYDLAAGWMNLSIDSDPEAYKWRVENFLETGDDAYTGIRSMNSQSFCEKEGVCLYPDNWLITPEIYLPSDNAEAMLSFMIKSAGGSVNNREYISVYVITEEFGTGDEETDTKKLKSMLDTNTDTATVANWPLGNMKATSGAELFWFKTTGIYWTPLTGDLTDHVGTKFRLAFRHWKSWNNQNLILDDIRITYRLDNAKTLSGAVQTGSPAEGVTDAYINVSRIQKNGDVASLGGFDYTTGLNGTISITGLEGGQDYRITANKEGFATYAEDFEMPNGTKAIDINFVAGQGVTGKVNLDNKSQGTAQGMNVNIEVKNAQGTVVLKTNTLPDGTVDFNLPAGIYSVKFEKVNYTTVTKENVTVTTDAGANIGTVILVNTVISNEDEIIVPVVTALSGNYPNPFNPTTTIKFDMAKPGNVKLEVFNIKGQKVKTLVNEYREAKTHTVVWTGTDDAGKNVGSGIYFYRMTTGDYKSTKKMLLMK